MAYTVVGVLEAGQSYGNSGRATTNYLDQVRPSKREKADFWEVTLTAPAGLFVQVTPKVATGTDLHQLIFISNKPGGGRLVIDIDSSQEGYEAAVVTLPAGPVTVIVVAANPVEYNIAIRAF